MLAPRTQASGGRTTGLSESFKVLLLELKSLALNIEPIDVVVESTPEEVAEESVLPEDVFIENDEEVNAVLNDSSVESLEEE